jgi:hypothetical protein
MHFLALMLAAPAKGKQESHVLYGQTFDVFFKVRPKT